MNTIKIGLPLKCERRRFGRSEKGDWELLLTRDEKGHCDIAVFANNRPSGVEEGGCFRVEEITGVSHGNRQDANGSWRASISINAAVTPVFGAEEFTERNIDDVSSDWKELTGTEGELPF